MHINRTVVVFLLHHFRPHSFKNVIKKEWVRDTKLMSTSFEMQFVFRLCEGLKCFYIHREKKKKHDIVPQSQQVYVEQNKQNFSSPTIIDVKLHSLLKILLALLRWLVFVSKIRFFVAGDGVAARIKDGNIRKKNQH